MPDSSEVMTVRGSLEETAGLAASYLEAVADRPASWSASVETRRQSLGGRCPRRPAIHGRSSRVWRRLLSPGWSRVRVGAISVS